MDALWVRAVSSPAERSSVSEALKRELANGAPLTRDAHGKPRAPGVHFNVSHDGDVVVGARHATREVGVDVVDLRRDVRVASMRQSFHPDEWALVLASTCPRETLLRLWARKEAVMKCVGIPLIYQAERVRVDGESPTVDGHAFDADVGDVAVDERHAASTCVADVDVVDALRARIKAGLLWS